MSESAVLPDFEIQATGNQRFQLSAFKGHPFVLYFHPTDDTPGRTRIERSPFAIDGAPSLFPPAPQN